MVAIDIEDQNVIVRTQGWDELWCFRSRVDFKISSVTKIYKKPQRFPRPWLRTGGTYVPWLIMAGRFRRKGKKEFWLSKFGRESIVFDMEGEEFDRVVVNVVDPDLVIARLSEKVNERWGKEEKKEKMIEVEATSMSPKTVIRTKA